jgi:hypothetical protein
MVDLEKKDIEVLGRSFGSATDRPLMLGNAAAVSNSIINTYACLIKTAVFGTYCGLLTDMERFAVDLDLLVNFCTRVLKQLTKKHGKSKRELCRIVITAADSRHLIVHVVRQQSVSG